jgi:hypothetical protein
MFLNSGDGVVFRGAFGDWWKREQEEYHLDQLAAKDLVERVVTEYKRQHNGAPPKELFIHGRAALALSAFEPARSNIIVPRSLLFKQLPEYRARWLSDACSEGAV